MRATWMAIGCSLITVACGDDGGDDVGPGGNGYFPAGSFYDRDVRGVPAAASSAAITAFMEAQHPPGGWGSGTMRIDFSLVTNVAPAGTERRRFEVDDDFYYPPACDTTPVPLPDGGAVEVDPEVPPDLDGQRGYDCRGFDDGGDCHLLVHAPDEDRLYEVYHATVRPNGHFLGGCLAVWDTSRVPPPDGRGQQCTSADAAGYAIAPLLVTPEEVMAGEIRHALRLVLPNDVIRGGVYFAPATHGTDSTGPADSLPYGGRMRLRADYPVEELSPAAQVVARAMQTYGMLLADGGTLALTMSSDVLSDLTWQDVGLEPDALAALRASDFEVLVEGDPIVTGATPCERTPITE